MNISNDGAHSLSSLEGVGIILALQTQYNLNIASLPQFLIMLSPFCLTVS